MLAVLKFFLGQDAVDEAGSDDEEGKKKDWDEEAKAKMPSKQDIYRAYNKVCVCVGGGGDKGGIKSVANLTLFVSIPPSPPNSAGHPVQ